MAATIYTDWLEYKNGIEYGVRTAVIPSADILNGNSTPIDLINQPGDNKAIILTDAVFRIDAYGGTPYATNTSLQLRYSSGIVINEFTSRLATAGTGYFLPTAASVMGVHFDPTSIVENERIQAYVYLGNPINGNSDIVIWFAYKKIPLFEYIS